ncbi:MAG: hypothetical protein VYC39_06980 [Myxococcota bacterium]|nr:hypothetical protein [Myxococcota bacterium]
MSAALNYSCDWKSGFIPDPTNKGLHGYLIDFEGLDMDGFLKRDIEVFHPFQGEAAFEDGAGGDDPKLECTGVIDSFSFAGGVGDPVAISCYISAENAEMLQGKMKASLSTNKVTKLSWWIIDFDEENKAWYEKCYPKEPTEVNGQLNATMGGRGNAITIAAQATKISPTLDTNVYNLYFEVIPAANSTFTFHMATSTKTKAVRNWGLKVGSNAESAMG